MGATRPQTPRRSPRQAFGGNSQETLRNPRRPADRLARNEQLTYNLNSEEN
jgi:hypothetical protein